MTRAQTESVRRINLKIIKDVPVTVSGIPGFVAVSLFQIFSDFFPKDDRDSWGDFWLQRLPER
jgi:hypothetical protein